MVLVFLVQVEACQTVSALSSKSSYWAHPVKQYRTQTDRKQAFLCIQADTSETEVHFFSGWPRRQQIPKKFEVLLASQFRLTMSLHTWENIRKNFNLCLLSALYFILKLFSNAESCAAIPMYVIIFQNGGSHLSLPKTYYLINQYKLLQEKVSAIQ